MFHDTHEPPSGTVFRDVITLALLGFVAMVVLVMPHLNPPGQDTNDDTTPPGSVVVEITWPPERRTDVDLWVQAPGDIPVGYSNKGGLAFNLLRDDLGTVADFHNLNYENAYTRGLFAGEYTVNVHLYRSADKVLPVPVRVTVSVKSDAALSTIVILKSEVSLLREGQELTVFRFRLTDKGALVPGSVHALPKGLRSGPKPGGNR